MLRAESLVNDGTALVVYGLAAGITLGEEHLGTAHIAWLTLLSYGGGATVGVAVAWLGIQLRKRLADPLLVASVCMVARACQKAGVALEPVDQQGLLPSTPASGSEELVHAGDHGRGVTTGVPQRMESRAV
jgi:hypothetical protein